MVGNSKEVYASKQDYAITMGFIIGIILSELKKKDKNTANQARNIIQDSLNAVVNDSNPNKLEWAKKFAELLRER